MGFYCLNGEQELPHILCQVLKYTKEKYGTEPEFLWEKTPDGAVLRHRDNLKWYAVILTVEKKKLGLSEDGEVRALNLKCKPDMISYLVDNRKYFPAYHMNKEHWISVVLDGTVPKPEIFNLIDISWQMTKKKR